ncbi:MAG: hypothetical protein LBK56_13985 [Gracilibacteraceae bacterium]|nr:hypothetical protein [Gracilibacteraceae bacterium]
MDKENRPVRDKGSTTYFAAIECAENFGRRLYAEDTPERAQLKENLYLSMALMPSQLSAALSSLIPLILSAHTPPLLNPYFFVAQVLIC